MKKELDDALCAKYPLIFKDRHADMRTTAMCWGFDCGDGWYALIDCLCSMLMWDKHTGKQIENPPIAMQVKEKFGTLRFYVSGATDAQYDLISFAEYLSGRTCETCGTTKDTFQTSGWIRTTCPICDPEEYKDHLEYLEYIKNEEKC